MIIHVMKNEEIRLTATGSTEMALLRKMADGVHVQAFDDRSSYMNTIILTPKLNVKEEVSQ